MGVPRRRKRFGHSGAAMTSGVVTSMSITDAICGLILYYRTDTCTRQTVNATRRVAIYLKLKAT